MEDIEDKVSELLGREEEGVWKKLNQIKEKVKKGYISDMEKNRPGINAMQSWRSKSGDFLEYFVEGWLHSKFKDHNIDLKVERENGVPKKAKEQIKMNFSGKNKYPDMDIVVFEEGAQFGAKPVCIISCKTSSRERVSQTLFWKLAMEKKEINIPFFYVTSDPDNELNKGRKWRPILEEVMDGIFMVKGSFDLSESIRPFPEILNRIEEEK